MSIFATDWGHLLVMVGVLISLVMDAGIAVLAWRLWRTLRRRASDRSASP